MVAQSAPVDDRVAVLIHNGTTKPVRVDLVTATATRSDGGRVVRARTLRRTRRCSRPSSSRWRR